MSIGAPGVFVEQKPSPIVLVGDSVFPAAIIAPIPNPGKGPIDVAGIVTSTRDYTQQYGPIVSGSLSSDAIVNYFANGGGVALIVRVLGAGSAVASVPLTNSDEGDTFANVLSISTGGTYDARSIKFVGLGIDGAAPVAVDLGSTAVNPALASPTEIAAAINAAGFGAIATVEGTSVRITSPTASTGSIQFVDPAGFSGIPEPTTFFGLQPVDIANIGVGNNRIDLAFDGLGEGGWEATIASTIFATDPTPDFGVGNHNVGFNIDGNGDAEVDISNDNGAAGSYTMADIAANINAALNTAYATATTYARVFPGRNQIVIVSPTLGAAGTVVVKPGSTNSAHLAFLGAEISPDGISNAGTAIDFTMQTGIGGYPLTPAVLVENLNEAFTRSSVYNAYTSAASLDPVDSTVINFTGSVAGLPGEVRIFNAAPDNNGISELVGIPEGSGTVTVSGTTGEATGAFFGLSDATTTNIDAVSGRDDIVTVSAANEGLWGNNVNISVEKLSTVSTAALLSGGTSVSVASVTDSVTSFVPGDMIRIRDDVGDKTVYKFVTGVNVGGNALTFQGSVHDTLPAGSVVSTASTHRQVTNSSNTATLPAATTVIPLVTTDGINVGAQVVIDDGTNPIQSVIVSAVPGDGTIVVPALVSPVDPSALVAVMNFDMTVNEIGPGGTTETITFLSAHPTDPDFIATRLSTAGEGSNLIEVTSLFPIATPPADAFFSNVFPHKDLLLTGGSDGATPGDSDYIAAIPLIHTSGIQPDVVIAPGITTLAVQNALSNHVQSRKDLMYIPDAPLLSNTASELLQYEQSLGSSSFVASPYTPWVVMADTSPGAVSGATKTVPPSPGVAGVYARVAAEPGVHRPPANFNIVGSLDLSAQLTAADQGLLAPRINVIRSFPGTGAAVIFDAFTLSSDAVFRFVSAQRIFLLVRAAMEGPVLRGLLFQPNNEGLLRQIKRAIETFLLSLWRQGMLVPQNDANAAFSVSGEGTGDTATFNVTLNTVFGLRTLIIGLEAGANGITITV